MSVEMTNQPTVTEGLVVYVTANCPFCLRLKLLLGSLGLSPEYVDSDNPANAARYHAAADAAKHYTVPLVVYKGVAVGGCDSTCVMVETGEFARLLDLPNSNAAPAAGHAQRRKMIPVSLFNFPPLANRWVSQLTSVGVVAVSAVIIAFHKEPWAWWVTFGMALDFLFRVFFGATGSLMGSVAAFPASFLPDELVPGAPKQFAAGIGLFMYGFATLLYLIGDGNDTSHIGGSVVIGVVMGAAALEAFFNFCFGCLIFGYLNKWGIIPDHVYQPYTDAYKYLWAALEDADKRLGWQDGAFQTGERHPATDENLLGWRRRQTDTALPRPSMITPALEDGVPHSDVDLAYKFPKTEDTVRENWGVAYLTIADFGMVLGLAGFAMVLRRCHYVLNTPPEAWQFAALFAGCIYGLMLIAMILRCVLYPKKVYMEVQHTMRRNAVILPPICNLVFSTLAMEHSARLQAVLWWAGAPFTAVFLVLAVAGLVKNRNTTHHIIPALLFPAAANILTGMMATFMAQTHSPAYMEAAQWFVGFGLLFFGVVLVSTLHNAVTYHWSEERARPSITMWGGACFIACLGWQSIHATHKFDAVAFMLFGSGVVFSAVVLYLIYPSNWLLRGRFEMSNWGVAFPADVAAVCAIAYYASQRHAFSLGLAWVFMVFAGFGNAACFFHTLAMLVKRRFPTPVHKLMPLSVDYLQHEALRALMVIIAAECDVAERSANGDRRLQALLTEYLDVLKVHTLLEDACIFPEVAGFDKVHLRVAQSQHDALQRQLRTIEEAMNAGDLAAAASMYKSHHNLMIDHMQYEEDHIHVFIRKGMNVDMQVEAVRKAWALVDKVDMERSLVTAIRYLPFHTQRVRLLRAVTWAVPERAQEIGLWLHRGLVADPLGDVKYALLIEDMPDIAPRGSGWLLWTRVV